MSKRFTIKDDEEQLVALQKAVEFSDQVTGDRAPSTGRVKAMMRAYQEDEVQQLFVLNPWAGDAWCDMILAQPFPKLNPERRLFCLSILSNEWMIDLSVPRSGAQLHSEVLRLIPKVKQRVRNRLSGVSDVLMMVEVGLQIVDKQQFLCLHVHGLGWGEEKALKARLKSLPPGIVNAKGGHYEPCVDRSHWVWYMTKDPRLRSITNRLPDYKGKKRYFKASEFLTKRDQFTFIQAIGDLTKPEMAFASGQAAAILSGAKREAIAQGYVPQVRDWSTFDARTVR